MTVTCPARCRRRQLWRFAKWAALLLVCFVLVLPLAPSFAQSNDVETGQLDVRIDKGFARLAFTFTNRPKHSFTANAGGVGPAL